jgi:DegV family protein with EDD domain
VIDSGHLSSGHGLLVLEACRLAEEGMSPADIAARLEQVKSKIHTSFVVDNLEFLARAGQVNPKTADLLKSILARPVLRMKKGKLGIDRFYFGTRERTWKRYINAALRNPSRIDKRVLFVTYVGLTKSDMDWIREQIEKKIDVEDLFFQKASPVIAVNCGAGTFGILTRDAERN